MSHCGAAPVRARQELDDRNVESARERLEDDRRGIAESALDLGEISLGGAGIHRQLAAGHAPFRARRTEEAADFGSEAALRLEVRTLFSCCLSPRPALAHARRRICTIIHVL